MVELGHVRPGTGLRSEAGAAERGHGAKGVGG